MEARPLPQRPSLEQYKKQAKDLLTVCKSADPAAIRAWAQKWFDECADDWVAAKAGLRGAEVTAALRKVIGTLLLFVHSWPKVRRFGVKDDQGKFGTLISGAEK